MHLLSQQLSSFVSRSVPSASAGSAPLLMLWVGQRACAGRNAALQALRAQCGADLAVTEFALAAEESPDARDAEFLFAPWPAQQQPSLGQLPLPQLQRLNLLLRDKMDALLGDGSICAETAVLAACVWADDPLAPVAAQLLHLAAQRYRYDTAGRQPRQVLAVLMPAVREMRRTAQTENLSRLLQSCQGEEQWPAAFLRMEDSQPSAKPPVDDCETYFISCERMLAESGAGLVRTHEQLMADLACLLLPQAARPGGRYLPVFRLNGQAEQHRLAAALADGLACLDEKDGRSLSAGELLQRLETQVRESEAPEQEFRLWMSRACIYRDPNAGTENGLFGDWLEQLCTQWEEQLARCPVPEQWMDELLKECSDAELRSCREKLRMPDMPAADRPQRGRMGRSADRQQLWENLLAERYLPRYRQAVQQRIRWLNTCLAERIDRLLECGEAKPDTALLREKLTELLRSWKWDGCSDRSGFVPDAEGREQLRQLTVRTLEQPQPDYTALFRFVQERLEEESNRRCPLELGCRTCSLETDRTEKGFVLWQGERRGQELQVLQLDRFVYNDGRRQPVGAQTDEIQLFAQLDWL